MESLVKGESDFTLFCGLTLQEKIKKKQVLVNLLNLIFSSHSEHIFILILNQFLKIYFNAVYYRDHDYIFPESLEMWIKI